MKIPVSLEAHCAEKTRRLADPVVRRWFENLKRGSPIRADNYLGSVFNFCPAMEAEPVRFATLPEPKLHEMLLDFVSKEEKRGIRDPDLRQGSPVVARLQWEEGSSVD